VHHRVKNNLAMILGLIEMQSFATKNQQLKDEFSEIRNRIAAMSLIHEKLYKSSNFARIDLKDYLVDLAHSIRAFFNKGNNVQLYFEIDEIFATSQKAIPIALIVTEAITNAFKYAFNQKTSGVLTIKLNKINEENILVIADNGPGISENIDLTKSKSLGFKLLNIFTKQLKGTYDIRNSDGLVITIKFNNNEKDFNS